MATRNLTNRFENLRTSVRRGKGRSLSGTYRGPQQQHGLLEDEEKVAISVGLGHSLPPEWVDIVEDIQKNVSLIKSNTKHLDKLHSVRLKVNFADNHDDTDREIEILTQEITRLFHKCENGLKRIATVGNARGTNLPRKERMVRLNVMRAAAAEIQSLSKAFRHQQKDFLVRLKGQEEIGGHYFQDDESKESLGFVDSLDGPMTKEQELKLQQIESHASAREQEIIRIAQSINELANIFKDLSVLVLEQGTVLDRIDYNVEQVAVKVKAGKKELIAADKHANSRTVICIGIQLVIIAILIALLVNKHKSK
eukprot:TRINITY_DN50030_c0_g1_i1.p1 TRINITY_DN50030_c0_g1~~TRINITY_DN50030_c0_g1_i1.p1  ORF type:complete len:318 (-),score=153.17 TRINITY_DN50030_c0_g1_i1:52-981(-)